MRRALGAFGWIWLGFYVVEAKIIGQDPLAEHGLPLHTEEAIEVYHEQVPAKANVVGLVFIVRLCWK